MSHDCCRVKGKIGLTGQTFHKTSPDTISSTLLVGRAMIFVGKRYNTCHLANDSAELGWCLQIKRQKSCIVRRSMWAIWVYLRSIQFFVMPLTQIRVLTRQAVTSHGRRRRNHSRVTRTEKPWGISYSNPAFQKPIGFQTKRMGLKEFHIDLGIPWGYILFPYSLGPVDDHEAWALQALLQPRDLLHRLGKSPPERPHNV